MSRFAWPRLTSARAFQLFQLFRQGAVILVAIGLAHSHWSVDSIGVYEQMLYLSYLLSFFWITGLLQGLLSYFPTLNVVAQRELQVQAFLLCTGLSLAAALLLWSSQKWLLPLVLDRAELPYLPLFLVFMATNIVSSLQEHLYLLRGQARALAIYGGVTAALLLVAVVLSAYLGYDLEAVLCNLAVLGLAKWLWLLYDVISHGRRPSNWSLIAPWWGLAWPLMLYAFLGALNQSIGPWLVGRFFAGDPEQFAIYRYGARELPLLAALAGALGSGMLPVLASQWTAGLTELKRESQRIYHIFFPLSILLMLTVDQWFPLVFSEDFIAGVPLFKVFLLLTAIHLIFARTLLVAKQDTHWLPWFALGSVVAQIVIGYWLIPLLGLVGVAWAAVLAFALEKFGLVIYGSARHQVRWIDYTPVGWWLGYTTLLGVCFAFC